MKKDTNNLIKPNNNDSFKFKKIVSTVFIVAAMFALLYFLVPSINTIEQLQAKVGVTASIYPNAKSLKNALVFIDDEKQGVDFSKSVKNKWSILYFGYTSCPDVCPVDMVILNQTMSLMQHSDKLQVVFVSVDPKRDIGNLSNFATKFNPNFLGLTAMEAELPKITRALGVYHEVVATKQKASQDHSNMSNENMNHSNTDRAQMQNNNYLINHIASFLLLNPNLELTALLTSPHNADDMAKALDFIITTM